MLKKILLSFAILSTQSIANNDDVIKNLFPIFGSINPNTWKNNLKKHLQCTLQTSHINEIDKNKLELFRYSI